MGLNTTYPAVRHIARRPRRPISGKTLNVDFFDGSDFSGLTIEDCILPGRLVLDFSRFRGEASVTLSGIRRPPTDNVASAVTKPRVPTSGERLGPTIVIMCPSDPGRISVSCTDLDLEALTLHHAKSIAPLDDPKFHLGQLTIRDCRLGALEAARIRAHDVSIRGLACERRVLFSEAIVEGAFEIRHAEIGDLVQLPGRAGQIWIHRSQLGAAIGAAMVVDGSVVLERVELEGPSGSVRLTGSRICDGFALLQSKVGGDFSLRECSARSISLEDSTIKGSTSIAIVDEEVFGVGRGLESPPPSPEVLHRGTLATASRCDFRGPVSLRSAAAAHNKSVDRPPLSVYAASTSFRAPARMRVTGPSVFDHCRFAEGASFRLGNESWSAPDARNVTLDLTRSWSGSRRCQVSGTTGDERLLYIDDFAADELRVERLDMRDCQLSELRVARLSIGSDVMFHRRHHPAWKAAYKHPFALEVADETFRAPGAAEVRATYIPGPAMEGIPWAAPGLERRLKWKDTPKANRLTAASDDDPLAEPRANERSAERLAQIYQSLSTAFDVQGDAAMSADFYWQHTRWRRKHLGRAKQLANTAYAQTPATGRAKVLARRCRRDLAATRVGGVGGTWFTLGLYQYVLGSGVRARTLVRSFVVLWLAVTVLACIPNGGSTAFDTRRACAPVKVRVAPALGGTIRQTPLTALPPAVQQPTGNLWTSPPVVARAPEPACWRRDVTTIAGLGLEYVTPIAAPNPHVAPPGTFQRGLYYVGHILGALLLAFFGLALRAKVRPRSAAGKGSS